MKFRHLLYWMGMMLAGTIVAFGLFALLPDHTSVASLKILQFLQCLALFVAPAILIALVLDRHPWSLLSMNTCPRWRDVLYALVLIVALYPAINLLSSLNEQLTLPAFLAPLEEWLKMMEDQNGDLLLKFLSSTSIWDLCLNILLMAVITAVGEELTFRGVLVSIPTRLNTGKPSVYIWVSAIIFSAIHLQFYGFVPRMLLGALFGYVLVWTGNLWLPILMHAVNNSLSIILAHWYFRQGMDLDSVEGIGRDSTWWVGVISMLVGIGILYMWRRSLTINKASSRTS